MIAERSMQEDIETNRLSHGFFYNQPLGCRWPATLLALFANLVDRPCKANQRLMSPYFGDLAEWLCKAFRVPGQKLFGW